MRWHQRNLSAQAEKMPGLDKTMRATVLWCYLVVIELIG
jgi:hypothetical protein